MPLENKAASGLKRLQTFLQPYVEEGYFTHYYAECGFLSQHDPILKLSFYPDGAQIFDLASLTKAVVTTPLIMAFADQHRLAVKDSVMDWFKKLGKTSQYIPQELQYLTVQSLLSHRSGLPAWRNFWINRLDSRKISEFRIDWKEHVYRVLKRTPLVLKDEGVDRYSDVGFILLAVLIEEITGQTLSALFTNFLVSQLGYQTQISLQSSWLGFPNTPPENGQDYISTGQCSIRQRKLLGEVHDENAAALGGVCGHAGLFGSGEALTRFIRLFLTSNSGKNLLHQCQNLTYGKDQKPVVIGWRAGDDDSSRVFGHGKAIGHMGFTGTAFWIDPVNLTYGIFLTNRVISGRRSSLIKEIRREVFSHFAKSLH